MNLNSITKYLNKNGIDLSYYSVQKAYTALLAKSVLRQTAKINDPVVPGNTREITYVESNYIPEKLGLKREHVIFHELDDPESVELFKKLCDLHPYTHYRTFLLGRGLAAYAQFDIPEGSEGIMNEFYDQTKQILGATKFDIIHHARSTYSELKIDNYDMERGKWKFNIFSEDEYSLANLWQHHSNVPNVYLQSQSNPIITELNSIEIQLIRELTINASVRAQDIHKYYMRDRTTISKYLSHIDSELMGNPTLYYDRTQFDLSSPFMLTGQVDSPEVINRFHQVLADQRFPFRSEVISDGPNFLIILMVPPSLGPEISYFIWNHIPNVQVHPISISLDNSWRYPFYPDNYDAETQNWKKSYEYLVTIPIDHLKN